MLTPLPLAAATSSGFVGRLAIPIWAVPSMMAAMPVVDPSAAMSKVVPGCCALNCSASCGTSFAPSVSEPLMTSRSAFAVEIAAPSKSPIARYFIFIGFECVGCLVEVIACRAVARRRKVDLEFQVQVGHEELVLVERIDGDGDGSAAGAETVIVTPAVSVGK